MRTAALFFVAAITLASAAPCDAARGTRKECKQTCEPRIEQDCGAFKKRAKRACKRAILRACRRVALESCFLTPATVDTTTTTTTSLVPSTTGVVPTTTPLPTTTLFFPTTTIKPTTTTRAPTTSTPSTTTTTTTLPFHYAGEWTFFGDIVIDDCAGEDPPFLDADVLVTHQPGASGIGVDVDIFPPLFGGADADGFDAANDFPDDDCTVTVGLVADVTPNPDLMAAALVIDVDCPGTVSDCTVAYDGDLER